MIPGPSAPSASCPCCGSLPAVEARVCRRCGTVAPATDGSALPALALSLAGVVFLAASLALPLVEAAKMGQKHQGTLLASIHFLATDGQWLLAALVLLVGILAPLASLLLLVFLAYHAVTGRPTRALRTALSFQRHADAWAMADVQVLAVLVAFVKLSSLVQAEPTPGLACYGASALLALFAQRRLPRGVLVQLAHARATPPSVSPWFCSVCHATGQEGPCACRLRRTSRLYRHLSLACTAGAFSLLFPAYLLPVMTMTVLGHTRPSSLLSSILQLWHHGLWGLALIIFVASVLVPLGKLLGLVVLHCSAFPAPAQSANALSSLYHALHAIGRWSMLDVFLVAFLAGLVQFGSLAQVAAAPGIVAFAGSVVLTVLATHFFDPRNLWPSSHE